MPLSISFRQAQESDVQNISKVHSSSIRELCSTDYSKDQIDIWSKCLTVEQFAMFIAMKDTVFLVVELSPSKEVIGFGHMGNCINSKLSSCVDYEVYKLYISPAFSKQGIGKALLAELESRAVELGCKRHIGIRSTRNAVPFYKSCGYTVVKDNEHCVEGRCITLECTFMEKKLQPYAFGDMPDSGV